MTEKFYESENHFFWIRKNFDKTMMFRNKKTNEKLYFDLNGVWNWEGISHSHLNEKLNLNK